MVARNDPAARADLVLESFVPFVREISIVGVRSPGGHTAFYPPVQNLHARGILARSESPAPNLSESARTKYEDAHRRVMEELNYVGVLTIEFFELPGGPFLANEMAPRVHNSGHWTIEGAPTSQFENHLRAILDLPLGDTHPGGTSVMLNIIGAEPDTRALLALPNVHVHLYGKSPRPGRKLGHVTIVAPNPDAADRLTAKASAYLRNC